MISSKQSQTSCYQCGYHITLPFSQNLTCIAYGSYLLSYSGISEYIKHMLTPKCYVYMIICLRFIFKKRSKLYLFYNDNRTIYSPYIHHSHWHRCLRSDALRVVGNRSTRGMYITAIVKRNHR